MTAKNLIKLNSVGLYLNTETLQTCADIKFPSAECVHLDECSDEWFLSLSDEDDRILSQHRMTYCIDLFEVSEDEIGNYSCLCDVPEDIRTYDCEGANSMAIEFKVKQDALDFIDQVLKNSPQFLYAKANF